MNCPLCHKILLENVNPHRRFECSILIPWGEGADSHFVIYTDDIDLWSILLPPYLLDVNSKSKTCRINDMKTWNDFLVHNFTFDSEEELREKIKLALIFL